MVRSLPIRTDGRAVSPGLYDAYVAVMKQKPTQSADTSSPRGTLTLFLDSCDEFYKKTREEKYANRSDPQFIRLGLRAISCLDTSRLPEYSREYFDAEAAVCLKEVLDRIPLPQPEEIPGIESVETADGSAALSRWQVPRSQIVITKIEEGPRRGEFLFSADTVARAPEVYQKARPSRIAAKGGAFQRGCTTGGCRALGILLWLISSNGCHRGVSSAGLAWRTGNGLVCCWRFPSA